MSTLTIRAWRTADNPRLQTILTAQMAIDPAWPPPYARDLDIVQWLGHPADLGRWVCELDGEVIGHIGLGALSETKAVPFCAATGGRAEQFAEVCRTVVDPAHRDSGAAALLSRTAIKQAMCWQRIPVATVLTGRTTWLQMMVETGWQPVGDSEGANPGERLVSLLPPGKFVQPVLAHG